MLSKSGRNYLIKSAKLLRFQQGYICPDQWTIEGEMTILWSITKLGKSVHRVAPNRSLALFGMSYKGAQSVWNSSRIRDSSFSSKKRTSFTQTSWFQIGNNLFSPYLLIFLMDFSQV